MTYTIHPGKHYSTPWRLRLYLWRKSWQWTCKLTRSCTYKPDANDHTNKLVGVGFLPHHKINSVRLGWRYESDIDCFTLWMYVHNNGNTEWHYLATVAVGEEFTVELEYYRKAYCMRITGINVPCFGKRVVMPFKWIGYGLKPYFGGQATAPHEMKIEVR